MDTMLRNVKQEKKLRKEKIREKKLSKENIGIPIACIMRRYKTSNSTRLNNRSKNSKKRN